MRPDFTISGGAGARTDTVSGVALAEPGAAGEHPFLAAGAGDQHPVQEPAGAHLAGAGVPLPHHHPPQIADVSRRLQLQAVGAAAHKACARRAVSLRPPEPPQSLWLLSAEPTCITTPSAVGHPIPREGRNTVLDDPNPVAHITPALTQSSAQDRPPV